MSWPPTPPPPRKRPPSSQHIDRRNLTSGVEGDVGPFFPSGMSAPEAAMAGATAGMSDEQLAKVEAMKTGRTEDVEDDGEDA